MRDLLGPRVVLLAAVLLATPVLAGCVGGAEAATAQQEQSTAEDHAQDWAADATLVGIVGVEGNVFNQQMGQGMMETACEGDYWDRAQEDGDVGDGYSEFWVYIFDSEEKSGLRAIALDANGELVQECTNEDTDGMMPVGEWSVDSDEATETAIEANEGLAKGLESDYHGLAMILLNDPQHENAVWRIAGGGGDASGGGGGFAVVDAVTGEVLDTQGNAGAPSDWGGS